MLKIIQFSGNFEQNLSSGPPLAPLTKILDPPLRWVWVYVATYVWCLNCLLYMRGREKPLVCTVAAADIYQMHVFSVWHKKLLVQSALKQCEADYSPYVVIAANLDG